MFESIQTWQPKEELTFEPTALEIIRSDRNVALLAGPGAGKTEILAQRACFLLETGCCPWPKNILAITRKREAASNIKERVELRCGQRLAYRFHSFTIEAFTKSILDRFIKALPSDQRPNADYKIVFNPKYASFPESLTFDQITKKAHQIMRSSPEVLRSIRATYCHIFIDEFQDLNQIQYDFIRLLFCDPACITTAVGDTKQAIMKFAKALPDVFQKFETDFSARFLYLYVNHRSSPELKQFLLNLAHRWWPTPLLQAQAVDMLEHNYALHCYQNEQHEADELSKIIQKWIVEDGIPPEEIAVLFRVNPNENYSKALSETLTGLNILNLNESVLQDHLSEPIGQILLNLLILLTRPRHPEAWEKLCGLSLFCRSNSDVAKNDQLILKIMNFILVNQNLIDDSVEDDAAIFQIVQDFFESFFAGYLEATWPQYANGDFGIQTIVGILKELGKNKKLDNSWKDAVDLISGVNAVRMMTIHKSKGLEFEAVILLGFEDNSYFKYSPSTKKVDEERSTVFVALSRAKRRLLISAALSRSHTGKASFLHIKQVITDIEAAGIKGRVVQNG